MQMVALKTRLMKWSRLRSNSIQATPNLLQSRRPYLLPPQYSQEQIAGFMVRIVRVRQACEPIDREYRDRGRIAGGSITRVLMVCSQVQPLL